MSFVYLLILKKIDNHQLIFIAIFLFCLSFLCLSLYWNLGYWQSSSGYGNGSGEFGFVYRNIDSDKCFVLA